MSSLALYTHDSIFCDKFSKMYSLPGKFLGFLGKLVFLGILLPDYTFYLREYFITSQKALSKSELICNSQTLSPSLSCFNTITVHARMYRKCFYVAW